jgi:hypothetical protein
MNSNKPLLAMFLPCTALISTDLFTLIMKQLNLTMLHTEAF